LEHQRITANGLPFLKADIGFEIKMGNLDQDSWGEYGDAKNHFDACSFVESSGNIRQQYRDLISAPADSDPFHTAWDFGEIVYDLCTLRAVGQMQELACENTGSLRRYEIIAIWHRNLA
jgi:hypothetical protein